MSKSSQVSSPIRRALVFAPGKGSLWLEDAYYSYCAECEEDTVVGSVLDDNGGWNMPEDYAGEYSLMHYPKRWIRKLEAKHE